MRDRRRATELFAIAAAALAAAIGAVSAAGWWLHVPALLELRPGWTPIPMNAAVALAVCGGGALCLRDRRVRGEVATLLGAGVISLCGATLAQAVLQIELAIDRALVDDWISVGSAHPGRMPPNTAIALGLAGAALVATRRAPVAAGFLGGLCAAIGATALFGYWTAVEPAHRWAGWPSMAPSTAAGLVALGISWWPTTETPRPRGSLATWRGPLVIGVAAASITLLFWQALQARDERIFRRVVEVGAQRIDAEIRADISDRAFSLAILASEWAGRFPRARSAWESDARLTRSQSPGLSAMEWIYADGTVGWVYPPNAPLPAPSVAGLPRSTSRVFLSTPIELTRGGLVGFRVLAPVRRSGSPVEGWISGVFEIQPLFADILRELDPSYVVEISSGGAVLFRSGRASTAYQARFAETRHLGFAGALSLDLRVEPSEQLIAATRSQLPPVLLFGGLFVSVLLTLALGLRGLASERAHAHSAALREIRRLNTGLELRVQQRTAELEHSNEGLRQFASFLSHELRQPLGAQAIWADLLESKYGDELDPEGRRCVSQLRAGATRMSELLDAQLSLAAGRREALVGETVALGSLAEEVRSALRSDLLEANAQVDQEPLPPVRGKRAQLEQLIRNLLENAIKYRCPDRPLRIRLSGSVQGANAFLRIEDNGRGFPLADADRIFEASVRLDPGAGPGDGMGLALCRQIAASHGGWIRARSTPGRGATFTVLLPAAGPAPGTNSAARERSELGPGRLSP